MENQKFGASQLAEQVNYQRELEGELARSPGGQRFGRGRRIGAMNVPVGV